MLLNKTACLFLFSFYCITTDAYEDIDTFSIVTSSSAYSETSATVTIVLWFNFTIYECEMNPSSTNSTYTCSSNQFIILGPSDCEKPHYNNIPKAKFLIDNPSVNAVGIASVVVNTKYGHYFGANSVCIGPGENPLNSATCYDNNPSWIISDTICGSGYVHYDRIMCDNQMSDCGPQRQIFNLDLTRPNEYISDSLWEDGTNILPDSKSCNPTTDPTANPTVAPSKNPTKSPTIPTTLPTYNPTYNPTDLPTKYPTKSPTATPTKPPTKYPTKSPTATPTKPPTQHPTQYPTNIPTATPTKSPTVAPSEQTKYPTYNPTQPTISPTVAPSEQTKYPIYNPTIYPTKAIDVEIVDVYTTILNKEENIIYVNDKNDNNTFTIVLVFSCVVLGLCGIITGLIIWIKKSKGNLQIKPYNHADNIGIEIERVTSVSNMSSGSTGGYVIGTAMVGTTIHDVNVSPSPPKIPPAVVTDYGNANTKDMNEGNEGHIANMGVENHVVNAINKTNVGNQYETPFQTVNSDDEIVNQINRTNIGNDNVTPFDIIDDNDLTAGTTNKNTDNDTQIWFQYANKYGKQPQNAFQLVAFSRTGLQYKSLSFKEATMIYNQMK